MKLLIWVLFAWNGTTWEPQSGHSSVAECQQWRQLRSDVIFKETGQIEVNDCKPREVRVNH